jgi:Leucine Rich repeat
MHDKDLLLRQLRENDPALKIISISDLNFGPEDLKGLCDLLKNNTTVIELWFFSNASDLMTGMGAAAMSKLLLTNTTLKTIAVNYTDCSAQDLKALCGALERNITVTEFRLGLAINRTLVGVDAIRELLLKNTTLTTLTLHSYGIEKDGIKCISEALSTNKTLTHLGLHCLNAGNIGTHDESIEYIDTRTVKYITDALEKNQALTTLDLTNNTISGLETISQLLASNKSLTHLDLGYNIIANLEKINEVLRINDSLTTLELNGNYIDERWIEGLSAALQVNTGLKVLRLMENPIGSGLECLSKALHVNMTLTTLDINDANIDDDAVKILSAGLKVNETLTSIDLYRNDISDAGAASLGEALKVNKTLIDINLGMNSINDIGIRHISEALKNNLTLTTLEIWDNPFGREGIAHLSEMIKENSAIISISLGCQGFINDEIQPLIEALANNFSILKIDNEDNLIESKQYPKIIEYITRNREIADCFKQILDQLSRDIGFIAVVEVKKAIGKLEGLPTLTDRFVEIHRLFNAILSITQAGLMQLEQERIEAEIYALELLLREPFAHTQLRTIASSLLCLLSLGGISQRLREKAPQAFWRLGMMNLDTQKDNPELLTFAYGTLFKLFKTPDEKYGFNQRVEWEKITALLSKKELLYLIRLASLECSKSIEKKKNEVQLCRGLVEIANADYIEADKTRLLNCQQEVKALEHEYYFLDCVSNGHFELFRALPLSPFFAAVFKEKFPLKSQFVSTLHCFLSEESSHKETLLIEIEPDKKRSLPDSLTKEKYNNSRKDLSELIENQFNSTKEEILTAVNSLEFKQLAEEPPTKRQRIIAPALGLTHFGRSAPGEQKPEEHTHYDIQPAKKV